MMKLAARTMGSRPTGWVGSVTSDAVDGDVDGGGGGHGGAGFEADGARGVGVGIVEADDHVGLAEALVEVVGEHGLGAVDGLFGGLADDHEGAVPGGLVCGEGAGGADEDGGVDVVAAGMHHADLLAGLVLGGDVGGVVGAGLLDDGECVHVAADEEGGAGSVFEDADDAEGVGAVGIDADMVGNGVPGFAEGVGEEGRGVGLEVGELGVGMELLVGGEEAGELLLFERGKSGG